MTYDLYFHDDFDGRASAAVFLAFLKSRGDKAGNFTAVDFDLQKEWLKDDFFTSHKLFAGKRNPAVVMDFIYHPQAAFWFDHHATTFQRPDWEKRFKKDKCHQLNPKYYSCCHLVLDTLVKNFGFKPPKHLRNLAYWLDIVDAARYKSARQAVWKKEPELQIDAFLRDKTNRRKLHQPNQPLSWLIRLLSEHAPKDVARDRRIVGFEKKFQKNVKRVLDFYKKNISAQGKVVFVDIADSKISEIRFAPYYLLPKMFYMVILKRSGGQLHIFVGGNPLRKRHKVDIGRFLKKEFGGGGHFNAGGAEFQNRKQAEEAVEKTINYLNQRG